MLEETSIGMANFCNFNLKNLFRNVAVRSVSSVLRIFAAQLKNKQGRSRCPDGVVVITPYRYSGGRGFKSRSGQFFMFFIRHN